MFKHIPVAMTAPIAPSMKRGGTALVFVQLVPGPIDCDRTARDPIGDPPDNHAQIGRVLKVVERVLIAQNKRG